MANFLLRPERPGREDLAAYRERKGYEALARVPEGDAGAILSAVEVAGLQGRGGGGFPAARKWAEVARGNGDKWVVVNGAEGEPGSSKDRFLMENHPHLVLEGALLAAHATGAQRVILAVNAGAEEAFASLGAALTEARAASCGADTCVEVRRIPDVYVAGEETALLEALEGKAPHPTLKPPFPVHFGLAGRPTLVHNVETVACVAAILAAGPANWRAAGTQESPGTFLYTLSGDVNRPGVYELPGGTTLRRLVYGSGGGPTNGVGAVLPGGYSGGILTDAELDLNEKEVGEAGGSLGCRAVRVLGERRDLWRTLEEVVSFFAAQSCGQCPPCFIGNSQLITLIRGKGDLQGALQAAGFLRGRGACGLLDGVAGFVQAFAARFPEARLQMHG